MEKVKITREQADEIVYQLQLHNNIEIVKMWRGVMLSNWADREGLAKCANDMPEDTLIRALYIGYEVEETPEDKVKQLYFKLLRTDENDQYSTGMIAGMKQTLEALRIKIEGVNS
jgi:hypothetical protein